MNEVYAYYKMFKDILITENISKKDYTDIDVTLVKNKKIIDNEVTTNSKRYLFDKLKAVYLTYNEFCCVMHMLEIDDYDVGWVVDKETKNLIVIKISIDWRKRNSAIHRVCYTRVY